MVEIQHLCRTIDRLADDKNWDEALTAAVELWRSSRDAEIPDREMRLMYVRTLVKVADLFLHVAADPYGTTGVLRRAYDLATDEDPVDLSIPSIRENVAHRLGLLYEDAKCHQSAVLWFKRALALARTRPVQDHLLKNLYEVAWNLEPLAQRDEPRSYYDEILTLLWPTRQRRLLLPRLQYLLPAAMYHLLHGDQQLGESVMLGLQPLLSSRGPELPGYFAAGLHGLANYHLANARLDDATKLARLVLARARRFGDAAYELSGLMHGVIAHAALLRGEFQPALAEIGEIFDLGPSAVPVAYGPGTFVENLELWRDVARIRAHHGDLLGAASAYETLAQALGTHLADGKTARIRLAWVRQQADVVHELVSVWLTVDDPTARQAMDVTVANALLQLKANLFLATEGNRLVTFRDWEGVDKVLFGLNRRFAAAARRVAAEDPASLDAVLNLEDALFAREQLESGMVANAFEWLPAVAQVFHFDFRELQRVRYGGETVLDYSLVEFRPPSLGLPGAGRGRRYVGIRLSRDGLRVEDLGSDEQVDALAAGLISEVARRPVQRSVSVSRRPSTSAERNLTAGPDTPGLHQSLPAIATRVYEHVVKPLEPIGTSVIIAPDGSLAALPFHALVREGRYLVEDLDVAYCHSLLQEESLARRQSSPGARVDIDVAGARDIVLLGDPDYSDGSATALPGTRAEVRRIARLLRGHGWSKDEVHLSLGPEATASRVTAVDHPRVLHLAAHGSYLPAPPIHVSQPTSPDAKSWRRWDDMASAPLSDLDQALLRATLALSSEPASHDDPAGGRLLTALELSSLDLIACRLAVLSACETGIGQSERGAGVLGFQYALLASFAHASLVSLWNVPDRETSDLMDAFYRQLIANDWDPGQAYLTTLRAACRQQGRPTHPYYWAAFVLLSNR